MWTRLWRAFLARWRRLRPSPSIVPETAPAETVGEARDAPGPAALAPGPAAPLAPPEASLRAVDPPESDLSGGFREAPPLAPVGPVPPPASASPEASLPPVDPIPPPEEYCYLTKDMGPEERNRRLREQFEKERRKHDKFVKPKGPQPVKRGRALIDEEEIDAHEPTHPIPEKEKARPIPALDGPLVPEGFIVDQHHEGGKVLFEEAEMWGQFNFRDTILGQLERYFVYLRRMRRTDKDAYDLYRAIGATIEPYLSNVWSGGGAIDEAERLYKFSEETIERMKSDELSPTFIKDRPAFGCVAFGTDPLSESRELTHSSSTKSKRVLWIPKFMYFTKFIKPPIKWQPMSSGGSVYGLTIWWDRPHDPKAYRRKYGVPQDFGVWVSKDGKTIRILKERLKWNRWAYPHDFKDWAKHRGVDVQLFLRHLFITAVRHTEDIELSLVRVNVHKRDLTAVFGVNVERLAYFFQDRDVALTAKGSRKRIFHLVKPYQRKDGSWTKMYFAGEREFEWAGYHVQLTVPGLHHESLTTFHYGSIDESQIKKGSKRKYFGSDYLGKVLAEYIRTGKVRKDPI